MQTTVRIYSQDLDKMDRSAGVYPFEANWDLPRKHTYTYFTSKEGEAAAEQAFHIFNAPDSMLKDYELNIAQEARSKAFGVHSLSVGDVVQISGPDLGVTVDYLCASRGWISRRVA